MSKIGLGLGLAALVGTIVISPPSIRVSRDGETFTITFEKGAEYACTVYRMTEATEKDTRNFADKHYAPRKCGMLDKDMTSYQDNWKYINKYDADWDVYAEIGYTKGNNAIEYLETNKLRVHR